jgi:hypothetical protein
MGYLSLTLLAYVIQYVKLSCEAAVRCTRSPDDIFWIWFSSAHLRIFVCEKLARLGNKKNQSPQVCGWCEMTGIYLVYARYILSSIKSLTVRFHSLLIWYMPCTDLVYVRHRSEICKAQTWNMPGTDFVYAKYRSGKCQVQIRYMPRSDLIHTTSISVEYDGLGLALSVSLHSSHGVPSELRRRARSLVALLEPREYRQTEIRLLQELIWALHSWSDQGGCQILIVYWSGCVGHEVFRNIRTSFLVRIRQNVGCVRRTLSNLIVGMVPPGKTCKRMYLDISYISPTYIGYLQDKGWIQYFIFGI